MIGVSPIGGQSSSPHKVYTDDRNEALGILGDMMTALQGSVPSAVGRPGAVFRYACGDLLASASIYLQTASLGTPLLNCFTQAIAAGATLTGMDAVRTTMSAESPTGQPGILVATAGIRFALIAEAQILADTTFVSSQDVFAALATISAAFDDAEAYAADNHDPATYQALIALGATVARDLTTRAAPLPRLTTYSFPRGTTSHVLAYRLYGDAGRAEELRAENKVIHPAFMPASGTALSE